MTAGLTNQPHAVDTWLDRVHHIGIHAVYDVLSDRGLQFIARPHRFVLEDAAPDMVGATFVYFTDPDGIGLEVYQKRSRFNDH